MSSQQADVVRALKRLEEMDRELAFDPSKLDSRPTPDQQKIIDDFGIIPTQWIVAANRSGKSQVCSKTIYWAVTDTHPTWKMPEEWKREGLLVLVAGKSSKIIEEVLWGKIRSYLKPGTYKEVKIGNILQRVEIENKYSPNKHRIIFQSMENVNVGSERVQAYDAHIAWADEMIDSAKALNEIRLRVRTKRGYFLCSFTPLKPSIDVKKLVDGAAEPHAKRYILKTLDNPVFQSKEARDELLSTFIGSTPEEIATRLHGEWTVGDNHVYSFDYDKMVETPQEYSTVAWRHVLSVDPALKSALGFTVWAENPLTNVWYCVAAEYIKGIYVPTELVTAVELKASRYNIVKRIADPHEVWYIQTAASMGKNYIGVYKKNERKPELIKQLQESLGSGRVKLCPDSELLISELQDCRFSDSQEGRIVNGSSYHLLDASQYFIDNIPRAETKKIIASSWDEWLYKANEKRLVDEQKQEERQSKPGYRNRRPRIVNRKTGSLWKLF